jgi:uncharacterized protein YdeI (YjbR/CyaY-like superfamily)
MAVVFDPDRVVFFDSAAAFGEWLEANHATAAEIWVGHWKTHTGRRAMTWSESVDEALRFGWIDSIVRRIDDERHAQRFTPRKLGSVWSNVNIDKIAALTAAGRMHPAGLAAFEARRTDRSGIYSFEQPEQEFTTAQIKEFRKHRKAWAWFEACPPSYRRSAIHWVVSAKKPETRDRRLAMLIDDSAKELRLKQFTWEKRP